MSGKYTDPWEAIKAAGEAQVEAGEATLEALEYMAKSSVDLENYALRLGHRLGLLEKSAPPRKVDHHVPTQSDMLRAYGLPPKYSVAEEHVVNVAIQVALDHAQCEEQQHRTWVIDQMVRILAGENYDRVIEKYAAEHGLLYDWDTGVSP